MSTYFILEPFSLSRYTFISPIKHDMNTSTLLNIDCFKPNTTWNRLNESYSKFESIASYLNLGSNTRIVNIKLTCPILYTSNSLGGTSTPALANTRLQPDLVEYR